MSGAQHLEELLDEYLDAQLAPGRAQEVTRHLEDCPQCLRVLLNRKATRQRLRGAVLSVNSPLDLTRRVRQARSAPRVSVWFGTWQLAMAAAVVILVAGVSYWRSQSALLPDSAANPDAYISYLGAEVSSVMRVGLNDHIHCTILQKPPAVQPTVADMEKTLTPEYSGLLAVVARHIPASFHVVAGHLCSYHGRRYVHVVASDGKARVSLLITARGEGENFENDLHAVASEAGVGLYSAKTNSGAEYAIAGFETPKHLVYLVSDLPANGNLDMLRSMTSDVTAALKPGEI
jgi:hypothetical protein